MGKWLDRWDNFECDLTGNACNKLKMEIKIMIIGEMNKVAPHIVELARKNLSKINFGSHTIDEEIEQSTPEYLIAYAHREKTGISIPDCIVLLGDYRRLCKIEEAE